MAKLPTLNASALVSVFLALSLSACHPESWSASDEAKSKQMTARQLDIAEAASHPPEPKSIE
jgi:hypothetical protein